MASTYATAESPLLSLLWIYSVQILILQPGFTEVCASVSALESQVWRTDREQKSCIDDGRRWSQ